MSAELEPHRRAVYGLCYRMLGSTVDAEDAVQETMLRAWKSQAHFEGRSATRTWLHRIATNVCIDRLRSGARRELPVPLGVRDDAPGTVDDEPAPDLDALDKEQLIALAAARGIDVSARWGAARLRDTIAAAG